MYADNFDQKLEKVFLRNIFGVASAAILFIAVWGLAISFVGARQRSEAWALNGARSLSLQISDLKQKYQIEALHTVASYDPAQAMPLPDDTTLLELRDQRPSFVAGRELSSSQLSSVRTDAHSEFLVLDRSVYFAAGIEGPKKQKYLFLKKISQGQIDHFSQTINAEIIVLSLDEHPMVYSTSIRNIDGIPISPQLDPVLQNQISLLTAKFATAIGRGIVKAADYRGLFPDTSKAFLPGKNQFSAALAATPILNYQGEVIASALVVVPDEVLLAGPWLAIETSAVLIVLLLIGGFFVSRKLALRIAEPIAISTKRIEELTVQMEARHLALRDFSSAEPQHRMSETAALNSAVRRLERVLRFGARAEELILQERARSVHSAKIRDLGDIAAGVAQELQTPIAVIQSLAEKIVSQASGGNSEIVTRDAQLIRDTANQVSSIARGFRNLSHEEPDEEFRLAPLHVILEEAIYANKERITSENITLDVSPGNPDLLIWCRPIQIGQVISHLLVNAMESVKSVEKKWIRIEVREILDSAFLSVTDSGPGITQHVRDHIMEPFDSTKTLVNGMGLGVGLSLSRDIMEGQGGSLTLDPKSENTRFVLRFANSRPGSPLIKSDPEF